MIMSDESFYPIIDVAGTPSDMGAQHGRQLRERIHATASAMREQVGREPYEACWDDFQETVEYCWATAPELMEEMEGIAEGAKISFRDVFRINAHLDLTNWRGRVWDAREGGDAGACSSHAVATGSEVLLGWNGDDWQGWMNSGALVRGRPDGGEAFIYWSLAGSVGRPGLGEHVALGANSLPSGRWRADGLLYPMVCRKLLACHSAQNALDAFQTYTRCSPMNYLVADRMGSLINVESTPDNVAVLRPDPEGATPFLLHTNSYLDAGVAGEEVDPDACPRLNAARRLYAERVPADTRAARAVLSDHTGGVCVHLPHACTLVSFVAEVKAGRIHVTRGNPCSHAGEWHNLHANAVRATRSIRSNRGKRV